MIWDKELSQLYNERMINMTWSRRVSNDYIKPEKLMLVKSIVLDGLGDRSIEDCEPYVIRVEVADFGGGKGELFFDCKKKVDLNELELFVIDGIEQVDKQREENNEPFTFNDIAKLQITELVKI
jgi:hypothetical protein